MRQEFTQVETDYDALVQSVTDYVIAINRNYQIIMANDLFRNEFGAHPGHFCFEAWKKRETTCEDCIVRKSFEDGKVHSTESAVVMKDGRVARMFIKSTPVRNEEGTIAYVLETATDVTEKRHLQEELRRLSGGADGLVTARLEYLEKSRERYRTIFERSRDAILLTDADGRIIEINQAGVDILGYRSREDLVAQKSAVDLFENRAEFMRFLKRVRDEGFVTEFETTLAGKGGRCFEALITCNVMVLEVVGELTGYVMIIRDVTERKQAQRQIEQQNARLAALNAVSMTVSRSPELKAVLESTIAKMLEILESDSIRIYILDKDSRTLHMAAQEGLSKAFLDLPHIRSRRVGDGLLGETIETCVPQIVDNLLRSEDKYVDALIREGFKSTVYVPLTSQGVAVGVMAVSSHSAFKFSSDYVEFLSAVGSQVGVAVDNANLYENLRKAYRDLREAQEQVIRTAKLASLGKLAATIAHEINNPLAAVLTYIRLMIKLATRGQWGPDRAEDIQRYLATMEAETARCGEIVKNLLAFSRRSTLTMDNHGIGEIIDKSLALMAHDLEMRGIRLVKDIEPDLPKIRCDFRQIQQALLNLMSNASEAMSKGGTLTVSASRPARNGYLEVVVSDTGCGIPEDVRENIFEPFFTTKEEGKGVGLGLSVVYGIVTRHNGNIDVESTPGKGSAFRLRLPIAQDDAGQEGRGHIATTHGGHTA